MGKKELLDLPTLSSLCLVVVVWLFLTVPCICVPFVIVVFPNHTHLLFLLSVTSESMCMKYWLTAFQACPERSVVR